MNLRLSTWWLALAVLVLPLFLYSDTIGARFGLRDDYSILREADDQPEMVFRVSASQGRPIYGWLLQATFSRMEGFNDLSWSRGLAALAVGLFGAAAALGLHRRLGWPFWLAYPLGAMLTVLPMAQILIGWGSCWPHVLACILAVAAFALTEPRAVEERLEAHPWRLFGGIVLLVLATLTYQSNTLCYLVMVAAGLRRRLDLPLAQGARWLVSHLALLVGALAFAYLVTRFMFALEWFPASRRIAFEADPLAKSLWFFQGPLANALALLVINDVQARTQPWHLLAATLAVLVLIAGLGWTWRRRGPGPLWTATLVCLLPASAVVSLIAAERWSTYRTIYALAGVVLVFLVLSFERLLGSSATAARRVLPALLLVGLLTGGVLARRQTYGLLAEPQMQELALIEAGAARIDPARTPSVYVITPRPEDTAAPLQYADEFGSLSTDSDWTPKEMLRLAMQERFPAVRDIASRYRYTSGRAEPTAGRYDIVIDLRRLREWRR